MLHLAFFVAGTKYSYCLGIVGVVRNTSGTKYEDSAIKTCGATCEVKETQRVAYDLAIITCSCD